MFYLTNVWTRNECRKLMNGSDVWTYHCVFARSRRGPAGVVAPDEGRAAPSEARSEGAREGDDSLEAGALSTSVPPLEGDSVTGHTNGVKETLNGKNGTQQDPAPQTSSQALDAGKNRDESGSETNGLHAEEGDPAALSQSTSRPPTKRRRTTPSKQHPCGAKMRVKFSLDGSVSEIVMLDGIKHAHSLAHHDTTKMSKGLARVIMRFAEYNVLPNAVRELSTAYLLGEGIAPIAYDEFIAFRRRWLAISGHLVKDELLRNARQKAMKDSAKGFISQQVIHLGESVKNNPGNRPRLAFLKVRGEILGIMHSTEEEIRALCEHGSFVILTGVSYTAPIGATLFVRNVINNCFLPCVHMCFAPPSAFVIGAVLKTVRRWCDEQFAQGNVFKPWTPEWFVMNSSTPHTAVALQVFADPAPVPQSMRASHKEDGVADTSRINSSHPHYTSPAAYISPPTHLLGTVPSGYSLPNAPTAQLAFYKFKPQFDDVCHPQFPCTLFSAPLFDTHQTDAFAIDPNLAALLTQTGNALAFWKKCITEQKDTFFAAQQWWCRVRTLEDRTVVETNPIYLRYRTTLARFKFSLRLLLSTELFNAVKLLSSDGGAAGSTKNSAETMSCTCHFFSTFHIPCQHIFARDIQFHSLSPKDWDHFVEAGLSYQYGTSWANDYVPLTASASIAPFPLCSRYPKPESYDAPEPTESEVLSGKELLALLRANRISKGEFLSRIANVRTTDAAALKNPQSTKIVGSYSLPFDALKGHLKYTVYPTEVVSDSLYDSEGEVPEVEVTPVM